MTQIRRRREVIAYQNDYVTAYDDEVEWPSGRVGSYFRLSPRGIGPGVVVIPEWRHELGIVKTYRYPIGAEQWAFPRGFSQGAGPLETAESELAEELGAVASSLELIGHLTPDSGLQSSRVAVVHAQVAHVHAPSDTDEVLATAWISQRELEARIRRGEVEDGFTLAALTLFRLGR